MNSAIGEGEGLGVSAGTFSNWGGVASTLTDTDFETAVSFYERVLKGIGQNVSETKEAVVLNKLGIALTSVGRQAEAVERFKQALELARRAEEDDSYGLTLNNLGLAYASFGRYSEAVKSFNEALQIAVEYNDSAGRAVILSNLGLVNASMAQYDKATQYYEDALKIQLGEGGSKADAGVTLDNLGVAYAAMGHADKALKQYEKAGEVARGARDAGGEAVALNNLANGLRELRQYEKAAAKYADALAVIRGANQRNLEGVALNGLGVVRYQQGRYAEAIKLFSRALPIRREVSNRLGEGITLHNLMLAWRARGNAPVAIFFGKQAVNVYQELRQDIGSLGKAPQESFLQSKVETYRLLADLLLSCERLPEAELVLTMLKEQELSEFTRDYDVAPVAVRAALTENPQLESEYQKVADEVASLGRQRGELLAKKAAASSDSAQVAGLDAQLTDLERKRGVAIDHFTAFLDQLQVELGQLGSASVDGAKDAVAMQKTLRQLCQGAVLLYTLVGEDGYRVLLITPDSQQAYETRIKRADLRLKVEDFRQALQNRRIDPAPLARELYQLLIGPALERDLARAGAQTLMWSLDGVLRYLPVAALQDSQGKYLVEQYRNVVFTPAGRDSLKDQVDTHWTGVGAGVSKAKPGFRSLPGVPRELHSIFIDGAAAGNDSGILKGKVLLDEGFTKKSFLASLSPAPPLIHIASHFKFQPGGTRDDSYLLLGGGEGESGKLTLKEVTHLDFQGVNLLTLSACDTALGDTRASGVEVESFGALAQRQGAEAVLATLWRVADGSTPLLMREFYSGREAGAGMTKAEALQKAQLALLNGEANAPAPAAERDSDPEPMLGNRAGLPPFSPDPRRPYAHPYYWAPFILIGNWK